MLGQSTINLLRAIEQGTQVFAPTLSTKESLAEFQEIVTLLRKIETLYCTPETNQVVKHCLVDKAAAQTLRAVHSREKSATASDCKPPR